NGFTPLRVGHANHGGHGHRRMLGEAVLHLAGIDVEAARDDHVLGGGGEIDITLGVHARHVPATVSKPAISLRRFIPFFISPLNNMYVFFFILCVSYENTTGGASCKLRKTRICRSRIRDMSPSSRFSGRPTTSSIST